MLLLYKIKEVCIILSNYYVLATDTRGEYKVYTAKELESIATHDSSTFNELVDETLFEDNFGWTSSAGLQLSSTRFSYQRRDKPSKSCIAIKGSSYNRCVSAVKAVYSFQERYLSDYVIAKKIKEHTVKYSVISYSRTVELLNNIWDTFKNPKKMVVVECERFYHHSNAKHPNISSLMIQFKRKYIFKKVPRHYA